MNAISRTGGPLLALSAEDIGYGTTIVLHEVSIAIHEGEKVALIGPSGAGKTTLLRRLHGLAPHLCAFIHQHHALVPQLSVFHNIFMGRLDQHSAVTNLINLLRPRPRFLAEIEPIAADLGLADILHARVGELSGGQQQRVGIGRAIYRGGRVLMADEPVSSLDMVQREEIMSLLVQAGATVVSSLHSVELARLFFDRIVGLKENRILFDLPAANVSESLLAQLYG